MAEERARAKLPEGIFDTLPDVVKQTMIQQEQMLIDNEKRDIEREEELKRYREEEAAREHREKLRESARAVAQSFLAKRANRVGLPVYEPSRRMIGVPMNFDVSSEFDNIEPQPIVLIKDRLFGFSKETILGMVPRMIAMINEARSHENVERTYLSYMIFHLWNGNMRRAGTRAVFVRWESIERSIDELFEELDKLVHDIKNIQAGYEYIFEGEANNYMHFNFTVRYYPTPGCVANWGEDVKPIEKRKDFDIFTASEEDTDCVLQCAQHIWGKEAKEDTIDKLIHRANGNVCIVQPRSYLNGISNVMGYKDIMPHPISPIKSINVIDQRMIYLICYNGHLGVLENMKEQKRNLARTTFRPLMKYPKCEKITVCFDIECYFDPYNESTQRHIPYLACACLCYDDEIGNVMEFEGNDCVAQMIDYVADICKDMKHQNVELVAHNGGGYDFHYILSSMYDPAIVNNIMMRNNSFISFKFNHDNITFYVKDSFNFLLCSLSSAAKAFLDEHDRKTDFPHHEIKSQEDLQRTFHKWLSVDTIVDVHVEKEKMLITHTNKIKYDEGDENAKRLIDWAREYCTNDVIVLAKVWKKFKQTVYNIFDSHIVDQTYTLAGLSFRLFEAYIENNVSLHHPKKEEFMNMRKALVGGRCISLNGIYNDILCLDVKSLYPAAMAFYDQPYGQFRKVKQRIDNELGIYYVQVTPSPVKGHGFFPLKENGNVKYSHILEPYCDWYTSVDIDIGIAEGHRIKYITFDDDEHVGYSWKQKGKIFEDYIVNILYKLKLMYEQEQDPEKRHVIKIIMNALWGKFAQKWMDTRYSIKCEDDVKEDEKAYKIWDTDHMFIKKEQTSNYGSKPVQNGVFVLSWARHHMKKIWDACAKPDAVCIYSDTDSILAKKEDIDLSSTFMLNDKEQKVIGSDIGQLELEHIFDTFICVGKKQYIGSTLTKDGIKYKKRFKGVPQQYIRPELFTHLIKDPSHTAQINFLKFKREWGSVHGYIESKIVKQT